MTARARTIALAVSALLLTTPTQAASPEIRGAMARIEEACLDAYSPELRSQLMSDAAELPSGLVGRLDLQSGLLRRPSVREKGPFLPSRIRELLPALRPVVRPGTRFLDLGSGDGRVVFLANVLGASATGIEWDAELFAVSRRAQAALEDLLAADRVRIVRGDFFDRPWSGYQVVYYFDSGSFHQGRLREKIRRELDPAAVFVVYRPSDAFPGMEVVADYGYLRVFRLGRRDSRRIRSE